MSVQKDLTEEIMIEIAFAIRKLGGEPGSLNLTDAWAVNRLLEFLGADIYLMATVGSGATLFLTMRFWGTYADGIAVNRLDQKSLLLSERYVLCRNAL
jgi:hypothetical protein